MRFSIIGTGFIFPAHVTAIRDVGGEIVDVVNDAHGQDIWKEMIQKTSADCVVILTPNDLHSDMALAGASAGKIVLCEKPLAIHSADAKILAAKPNIFTVLQLRYHPLMKYLQSEIKSSGEYEIDMDISIYRDEKYFQSWKGMKSRSGGVLFNIGIHYFDALVYLFGDPIEISVDTLNEKTGAGKVQGSNYVCSWRVSINEQRENQRRVFQVNGREYNFSVKDNLSYENLHRYVFEDLLKGRGVTPQEALRSIELIERIYETAQQELLGGSNNAY